MRGPVDELTVWRQLENGKRVSVGRLAQNAQGIFFSYTPDYFHALAISLHFVCMRMHAYKKHRRNHTADCMVYLLTACRMAGDSCCKTDGFVARG